MYYLSIVSIRCNKIISNQYLKLSINIIIKDYYSFVMRKKII